MEKSSYLLPALLLPHLSLLALMCSPGALCYCLTLIALHRLHELLLDLHLHNLWEFANAAEHEATLAYWRSLPWKRYGASGSVLAEVGSYVWHVPMHFKEPPSRSNFQNMDCLLEIDVIQSTKTVVLMTMLWWTFKCTTYSSSIMKNGTLLWQLYNNCCYLQNSEKQLIVIWVILLSPFCR